MAPEKDEGAGVRLRILIAILLFPMLAHAESSALIISGAPGDDEHVKKYTGWTESTRLVLAGEMGFNPGRIMVLSGEKSTQAEIKDSFAKLKEQLKPADTFLLVLIGHGSFDGEEYKFNNVGPDLSGSDFNKLL